MQREITAVIRWHKQVAVYGRSTHHYDERYKVVDIVTFEEHTGEHDDGYTISAARAIANRINGFDSTAEELLS